MIADAVYVDPSALRSLYLHDVRSVAMARWRSKHPQALPVTLHGRELFVSYDDRQVALAKAAGLRAKAP